MCVSKSVSSDLLFKSANINHSFQFAHGMFVSPSAAITHVIGANPFCKFILQSTIYLQIVEFDFANCQN